MTNEQKAEIDNMTYDEMVKVKCEKFKNELVPQITGEYWSYFFASMVEKDEALKQKAFKAAKEVVRNPIQAPAVEYDPSKDQFSDHWIRVYTSLQLQDDIEGFGDRSILFKRAEEIYGKRYHKLKAALNEHGADAHHWQFTNDSNPKPYDYDDPLANLGKSYMFVFTNIEYSEEICDMFRQIFSDCGFVISPKAES